MIRREDDQDRIEDIRRRHAGFRNPGDERWRDIDALLAELDNMQTDFEDFDEAHDEEISRLEGEIDRLEFQLNEGLVGLAMKAAVE